MQGVGVPDDPNKHKYANQIILDLKKFNIQDIVIKRKIIIYTIKKVYGSAQNIEKIHIDDIIKLCERNIGNKYLTPHKNIKVYIKNKKIFFIAYPKLPQKNPCNTTVTNKKV